MAGKRADIDKSIQGLRGAAALAVMLVHVGFMAAHGGLLAQEPPRWVEQAGPYAVMLFFCISGCFSTGAQARQGVCRHAWNLLMRT